MSIDSPLPSSSRPSRRDTNEPRAAVAWASLLFSQLLLASFVLRAIREEMGVAGGVKNLPWMFSATFVVTLALVPVFGWAAAKLDRRALASAVYGTFALSMIALWLAHGRVSSESAALWVSRIAFVWLSVINMIAVSTFWGLMVDMFPLARAKRWFGTIAAGGTAGALAGSSLATLLAELVGTRNLLLVSMLGWFAAVACARRLEAALARSGESSTGGVRIGGSMLAGLRDVVRTPTLRGIGIYVLLYTATSTVLYVVQGSIVGAAIGDADARTAYFARLDLVVSAIAFVLQLGATRVLLQRLPVTAVLMILPVATIGVLLGLGLVPTLAVLSVLQVARRVLEHAVAKPGRELLYEHAGREVKLKGQNAVDTAVYRAGDMASGWVVAGLGALGLVGGGLLLAFVPVAMLWAWFAARLAPRG